MKCTLISKHTHALAEPYSFTITHTQIKKLNPDYLSTEMTTASAIFARKIIAEDATSRSFVRIPVIPKHPENTLVQGSFHREIITIF